MLALAVMSRELAKSCSLGAMRMLPMATSARLGLVTLCRSEQQDLNSDGVVSEKRCGWGVATSASGGDVPGGVWATGDDVGSM